MSDNRIPSLIASADLSYWTPSELVRAVLKGGGLAPQALEELRERALCAPHPFRREGTM